MVCCSGVYGFLHVKYISHTLIFMSIYCMTRGLEWPAWDLRPISTHHALYTLPLCHAHQHASLPRTPTCLFATHINTACACVLSVHRRSLSDKELRDRSRCFRDSFMRKVGGAEGAGSAVEQVRLALAAGQVHCLLVPGAEAGASLSVSKLDTAME